MSQNAIVVRLEDLFQEERRSCLGGTDIAAILGIHPYRTAFDVWLEKTGQAEAFEGNERTEMGTGLEPYIAAKYEKQTGHTVVKGSFIRHPEVPYFGGHVDYVVPEGPHVVECKLVGVRALYRWTDPGPEQVVPDEYWCQAQWYQMLTGYQCCDLVAQKEFKVKLDIYPILRDDVFIERAILAGHDFWNTYVLPKVAPPLSAAESAGKWLAKTYPHAGREIIQAPEHRDFMEAYFSIESEYEEVKRDYETTRNRIKNLIGENLGFKGPGFVAKWYDVKDSVSRVVDWRAFIKARFAYEPTEEDLEPYTQEVVVRKGGRRLDINKTSK